MMVIGVDGGGTHIRAVAMDATGRVMDRVVVERSGNYRWAGSEAVAAALAEAVGPLLARYPIQRVVAGLAGCRSEEDRHRLRMAFTGGPLPALGDRLFLVNDVRIALRAGAADDWGMVVVAGTGSHVYARTREGRDVSVGGYDYPLADEGSGYDIGVRAIRAVLRAEDGRGEATTLRAALFARLDVTSVPAYAEAVLALATDKRSIAGLATLVREAQGAGDVVAGDILNHAVQSLVRQIDAAAIRLHWRDQSFPLVCAGGLLRHDGYVRQRLRDELTRVVPNVTLVAEYRPAEEAAGLLALDGTLSV